MKMKNYRRVSIAAATAALGLTLVACSDNGSSAPATVTETVASTDQGNQSNQNGGKETVTVTSGADANANGGNAGQGGQAGGNTATNDLPTEITGYSGEAERDLTEEYLTKDEVTQVLQRAHNGEGKVKWDNDGYWEVEVGGVDVDIDKNGLVLDVDR